MTIPLALFDAMEHNNVMNNAAKMPVLASPVSVHGEDACALADALGCGVEMPGAAGGRAVTTAEARAFMATRPGNRVWAEMVWLVVAYNTGAL